jgi:D-alanine-D-alanine ligase
MKSMPRAEAGRKGTVMERARRIRLGILFGGKSGEHEISVRSAASVIEALDSSEYDVKVIGITKSGRLATAAETGGMLPPAVRERVTLCDIAAGNGHHMQLLPGAPMAEAMHDDQPEIIFPLLHGPYGEDGTIQGLLEIAGLPYVGCGVLASAVGMDKDVMKRLFMQAGLPVLPFSVVRSHQIPGNVDRLAIDLERDLGYPMFSKPANLGSSVGVCKVHSRRELADALAFSAQFDRKVVIEKGIDARELECAILGNDSPQASIVGEIIPAREYYDYQAKYADPNSRLEIPAPIPADKAGEIRSIAVRAFELIDGSGLARVDFFMERETGTIWLNEINTMPGFTPISMYAKLWAAAGVRFPDLIRSLVRLGLERHAERTAFRVSG